MNDLQWDKKLKIDTIGRDDSNADEHHNPYEPTPYCVLLRLAESGYISYNNLLVDYGCGKGRVSFFMNQIIGCRAIGIEYDRQIYVQAVRNQRRYPKGDKVEFICTAAENFEIESADCFYFFNPFSIEILRPVLDQILKSYYDNPRTMRLFFYYPDDEYLSHLMTSDEFTFVEDIDCKDLFGSRNRREKISIFEIRT